MIVQLQIKVCSVHSHWKPDGFNEKIIGGQLTSVAMHPFTSEADISTERFRHSDVPIHPTPQYVDFSVPDIMFNIKPNAMFSFIWIHTVLMRKTGRPVNESYAMQYASPPSHLRLTFQSSLSLSKHINLRANYKNIHIYTSRGPQQIANWSFIMRIHLGCSCHGFRVWASCPWQSQSKHLHESKPWTNKLREKRVLYIWFSMCHFLLYFLCV